MTLIRRTPRTDLLDPFGSLSDIREEVNRLFDTSLRRYSWGDGDNLFTPALDVEVEKDNVVVTADLPGLRKEDVSVTLQDQFLLIKGEKKHEVETKERNFYHRERVSGTFTRAVELPASVEAKKIDAQFKDGVLRIVLPKAEEAKPKEIDIKVN